MKNELVAKTGKGKQLDFGMALKMGLVRASNEADGKIDNETG
ncbi:MAG: hypothetical protein VB082_07190 [Christensenella sp.]|nr:hypothetical protein [Christensenella sp.]